MLNTHSLKALVLLVVLTSTACIPMTPAYVSLPPPSEKEGVIVSVDRAIRAPYGYVGLSGLVTNNTEQDLPECRITLRVYDHEMDQSGRARVTVKDLRAGETRDYQAKFGRNLKIVRTVSEPEMLLFWEARPGS